MISMFHKVFSELQIGKDVSKQTKNQNQGVSLRIPTLQTDFGFLKGGVFLYFWHDNQLTLKSNGKTKVIDVTEGELIAFPSLLRYEFKNDTVTGYDLSFREHLNN